MQVQVKKAIANNAVATMKELISDVVKNAFILCSSWQNKNTIKVSFVFVAHVLYLLEKL